MPGIKVVRPGIYNDPIHIPYHCFKTAKFIHSFFNSLLIVNTANDQKASQFYLKKILEARVTIFSGQILLQSMFIFLSKLLPLFVYPLGLACVLLLAALVNGSNHKRSRIFIILSLVILWLSSTSGISNLLARSLEWRYKPPEKIPTSEVIVLLGGGTEPAVYPRSGVEINGAGDRVFYAAQLYKEGKAPLILLSGGEITWLNDGSATPAEDMAKLLISLDIPRDALIIEDRSRNTYENALYAKELLGEKGINKILLVTSAMHMPRSVALFEEQGFEVTPLPVDYSVVEDESTENQNSVLVTKILNIIPNASNLGLTTNALKEYLGSFIYRLQGWL
jgi:uncharacterized SAM-binding protein YcdF (DUF218 family)